ncbi:MAG: hypothetical protein WBG08_14185 [Litorimonas sp.]
MPNLRVPLFLTRILIAIFLLPWTVMRFVRDEAAQGIAERYYKIGFLPDVAFLVIAIFMALLLLAFTIGFRKKISYGLVFLLHTIGTIMTVPTMLPVLTGGEGGQILFFAALPVIGAMLLLYLLRDQDTLLSVD